MDFCSIWNRHMKKRKTRAVWAAEAITNAILFLSWHMIQVFWHLLLPSEGCSVTWTAPVKPFLTTDNVTKTGQAQFFTSIVPTVKGDTCYFKSSNWEDPSDNQWDSPQDPARFPHNSPGGLVNSPPGATVPKETKQQTTSSHESPWGFQWEMDVYTQL